MLFLATPFVVKTSWPHYFAYLPLCQAALWLAGSELKNLTARVIVRFLVAVSVLLSSLPFFYAIGSSTAYVTYGALLASDLLLFAGVLLLTWQKSRQLQSHPLHVES